jgi:hypothetical protein
LAHPLVGVRPAATSQAPAGGRATLRSGGRAPTHPGAGDVGCVAVIASPVSRARALVLAAAVVVMAVTGCGSDDDGSSTTSSTSDSGAPVFPLPEDAEAAIKRAGLKALPEETLEYHIHPELQIFINDEKVKVPANIGIDLENQTISPLHTHDDSGTIHIEAPEPGDFTLEQLFQEWDVKLDKDCIGTYCADDTHQFVTFVDGERVPDPTEVVFEDKQQIVLWYGPKDVEPTIPSTVPSE